MFAFSHIRACAAYGAVRCRMLPRFVQNRTAAVFSNTDGVGIRPSFDYERIASHTQAIRANITLRKAFGDPERIVALYEKSRKLKRATEELQKRQETISLEIKAIKGKEERQHAIQQARELKEAIVELGNQWSADEEHELMMLAAALPNDTHPDVPRGSEANARVIAVVNQPTQFSFQPRNHIELLEKADCLDFDAASVSSGSKFYFLKRAAAMLELGLMTWTVNKLVNKGFIPVATPDLVRTSVLDACGFKPRQEMPETAQNFYLENNTKALVATQEIAMAGMLAKRVLRGKSEFPLKYVAYGHSFRREVGSPGMERKGLYRVKQFTKVEMFVVTAPEDSDAMLEELVSIQQELFAELGLHYRVLDMPTEELGASAYRKYDIEAWMPHRNGFGEISSASNCTDFQSRRLDIRYRTAGTRQFVHTLNATACAVPRMIVAIVENNQQADGTVIIPKVLQPFVGLDVIRPL
eukprot:TRINITY_DN1523_c0_g1_i3.p1 TRINITY_DN1523_c0_g1~~TRINITY_DN1523_c0_g1_i3.p1  ORF type:complete len:469 (+),score=79.01 TRINITY_DN1523_c0_g1_i3:40-1446(+)